MVWCINGVPHFSEALWLYSFFFFFFLLLFQIVSSLLGSFQVCWFFCQLQSAGWPPLVNFYFGYCAFQLQNYPLDLFINIIFISLVIVSFDKTLLSYFSYFFKHGFSLVLWIYFYSFGYIFNIFWIFICTVWHLKPLKGSFCCLFLHYESSFPVYLPVSQFFVENGSF